MRAASNFKVPTLLLTSLAVVKRSLKLLCPRELGSKVSSCVTRALEEAILGDPAKGGRSLK